MRLSQLTHLSNCLEAPMVGAPIVDSVRGFALASEGSAPQFAPQDSVGVDEISVRNVFGMSAGGVLMHMLVLAWRQASQVLNSIVVFDSVEVMDVVPSRNSSVRRFPDQPMLGHVAAIGADQNVAEGSNNAPALPSRGLNAGESAPVMVMNKSLRVSGVVSALRLRRNRSTRPTTTFAQTGRGLPVRWRGGAGRLLEFPKSWRFEVVPSEEATGTAWVRRWRNGLTAAAGAQRLFHAVIVA